MNASRMALNLAGEVVGISLHGRVVEALPLCRNWFAGFFTDANQVRCRVHIETLEIAKVSPELRRQLHAPVIEALLPAEFVISELPQCGLDPGRAGTATAARCIDGLMLFVPERRESRIWLTNPGAGCFRPLHRLLWMALALALGESGCFFGHCAAVENAGKAYLFWGESGAGKSTVASLLKDARLLSDDAPILALRGETVIAYASPFRQKREGRETRASAVSAEIAGFYFLEKDRRLFLQPALQRHAFAEILRRHVHFFDYLSSSARATAFEMLHAAVARVPQFRLHFPRHAHLWPLLNGGSNALQF